MSSLLQQTDRIEGPCYFCMGLGWKVLRLRAYLPAMVAKVLCPDWRDRELTTSGQVKDEFELSPPLENTPAMAGVAFSGADDW